MSGAGGGGFVVEVLSLRATGFDAVEQTWREFVPSARLREPGPDVSAELAWQSAAVEGLSAVAYQLSGSVRSSIEPHGQLMACRVATDDGWVGVPRRQFDTRLPWASSGAAAEAAWDGTATVRALIFDLESAQHTARLMSGDDGLVLDVLDPAPRSAALGAHWERTQSYVLSALVAASRSDESEALLEAELSRHALHATLSAFSTTFAEALERSAQPGPAPRSVRRAISFMESRVADPITIDDVAASAGMSTRGLQAAFRRALDTTPTEYLRGLRLAGAHEQLRAGGPETVAEVARTWGFAHPSRFAAFYRERYGRSPSDTVRRG
ncbi:helix-turn-helix domain-containing protein [Microbacterium sp. Sa1CUA4]|uniref:Helix-turn-helix domain-containing protein n=1 Tax=Microbacterium gallinarum TaxID=2762209 RepID=A0ABR8X675_9MICO|nr:helix-turn-helix domain-containing protein [Microbacterium gallinarum]